MFHFISLCLYPLLVSRRPHIK